MHVSILNPNKSVIIVSAQIGGRGGRFVLPFLVTSFSQLCRKYSNCLLRPRLCIESYLSWILSWKAKNCSCLGGSVPYVAFFLIFLI